MASPTAGELIKLLAALVGMGPDGVASSGTTTTIVDTNALSGLNTFDTTDDAGVVGSLAYIWAGTNAGAQRRVSALNISTVTATVSPAYASAIDTTSKYVIIGRWDGGQCLDALIRSRRMLTWEPRLSKGIMKETGPLRHIQLGNALLNPVMDLFTTANVLDSWTNTGSMTMTEENTVTYGGARSSVKLVTSGAAVGNLNQSLTAVGQYPSSFEVYAWIWCEIAGEVFLRVNDGVDNHDSAKHGGTGWEKIKVTVTPSAAAAAGTDAMTVRIMTTTAATAVTFYVQNVWFPKATAKDHRYALDADIGLVVLNPTIYVLGAFSDSPNGNAGTRCKRIDGDAWQVERSTTRQINLSIGSEYNGHIIELTGWQAHTALTAVSSTWAGSIEGILEMAAAILHAQKNAPLQQPSIRQAASPETEGDLETVRLRTIAKYGVSVAPGYKLVETTIQ